ncbi:PEP-CTERM sorting domain-containing protein [Tolypothrix sp. VBCCA 56010]|uniref:PEP-CTERM sorting domain-containing protein n=1 Tax=Tolypothrix sp. VBCCA 56010 TaxID=3137731 RepID=UPI003D7CF889
MDLQNQQPTSDILSPILKTLLKEQSKPVPEPSAIAGLIMLGAAVIVLKRKRIIT